MLNYKWKICNGQTKELFDHFKSTTYFKEKELNVEGFIQNIEQFYLSPKDTQLAFYRIKNQEAYNKYWKNYLGEYRAVPLTSYYVEQYINDNNLIADFIQFLQENNHLFINYKSKHQILQTLINNIVQPILQETRGQYFFIYRDYDNKGLYIERPVDKKYPHLFKLLEQFQKKLSQCIVDYDPSQGDKKQIIDMMNKISNFREIYFIQPQDYKTLISIFNRIKINLRRTFNPNPFLVELNQFIDKVW